MGSGRRAFPFVVVAVGLGAGILCVALAAEMGGKGGEAPSRGDVDGSSEIDLTDAVYLLNYLFKGGPPPVECPAGAATPLCKFRVFNDLFCGAAPVTVTLTACETSFEQSASTGGWTTCIDVKAGTTCLVRISAIPDQCGTFCFEQSIDLVDGHVYNFVISVDDVGLFAIWFDQEGNCTTAPPAGGDPFAGQFPPCAAAVGAGAADVGPWRSTAVWSR